MPLFPWRTKYPYTNFHELNLDWLLMKVKELDEKFNDSIVSAINAYVNQHLAQLILSASYNESTKTLIIEVTNL